MSAILDTKKASERLLKSTFPIKSIAFEGVPFEPPSGSYLRCQFMIGSPVDPVFNKGYHREQVQFQVFVVTESGMGTSEAYTDAEVIRSAFMKGTYLLEGTTKIYVLTTPKIGGTIITDGRVVCPVLIDLLVEVYQ